MSRTIRDLVADLNSPESFLGGPHLVIGKVYAYKDGAFVKVTDGQYLGYCGDGIGRISNFWYWDFVDEHHEPTGKQGHGYGWAGKPHEKVEKTK